MKGKLITISVLAVMLLATLTFGIYYYGNTLRTNDGDQRFQCKIGLDADIGATDIESATCEYTGKCMFWHTTTNSLSIYEDVGKIVITGNEDGRTYATTDYSLYRAVKDRGSYILKGCSNEDAFTVTVYSDDPLFSATIQDTTSVEVAT